MSRRKWTTLLVAGGLYAHSTASVAPGQQVPLFIFAGQSNMVGYATDSNTLSLAPQPRVLWAGRQELPVNWQVMTSPTETSGQIFSGHGFGPEISAPLTISNGSGQTVGAVKLAVNDTGFGADIAPDWRANGGLWYSELVSRVNSSITQMPVQQPGKTATPTAMFWMQGERDASDEDRAGLYQYNLTKLITQVRADVGNSTMPFIIGRIGADTGPHADVIRRAQENIARVVPNVRMIDTDDLERASGIPSASIHFSTQGTYALGVRFGQAYLDMTSVTLPARPESSINKLNNGSFEDYAIKNYTPMPGHFGGQDYPADLFASVGWSPAGAGATLARAGAFGPGSVPAAHGSQWMSLENRAFGTGDGGVQQSFTTKFSTLYTVFFNYAALANGNQATATFTADANGASGLTVQTLSVNTSGFGNLQMTPWSNSSFSFTSGAAQTSANLRFLPLQTFNDGFYGPGIDDVRVVEGSVWKTNSGNWSADTTPWINGVIPNGSETNANFLWLNNAASTVTVTAPGVTTTSLRIDSPNGYTFTGGQITFNRFGGNNADRVSILVGSGSHSINNTVELRRSMDVEVASGASLTINGQIMRNNDVGWGLTKFGGGVLTLAHGDNRHNGPTRIVEGTLRLVNGDSNNIQNSPSITVFKGATFDVSGQNGGAGISLSTNQSLGGAGTVVGPVTATTAGNVIAPGHSTGKLTFAGPGNVTLNTNATVQVEISTSSLAADVAGINYDQIVIDGAGKSFVTGGAKLQLIFGQGLTIGRTYTILSAINGATINASAFFKNLLNQTLTPGTQFTEGGRTYSLNYTGTEVTVLLVPEPAGAAGLGALCCGLALRRRRAAQAPGSK